MRIPEGKITRVSGTCGGLMLALYPAFPEDCDTDTPLVVTSDGLDVPLYCDRFERRGVSGAAAAVADFDTDRRAQELLWLESRIETTDGESDEFYHAAHLRFAAEAEEVRTD